MGSYITHTAVAKLDSILVEYLVVLVLTVKVGGDQITKYSPNIGFDIG